MFAKGFQVFLGSSFTGSSRIRIIYIDLVITDENSMLSL